MTILAECKQKALVDKIMTKENASTEATPGHYETGIFFASNQSERQSFQCLHLRQGTCMLISCCIRKRDREPSRLPREVLKSVQRRKVRGRIKHFLKKSVSISSFLFTVATSCKVWIVKLAHEEESLFTI